MMRKVLVVIGTTGVGKTKLSIDLAKAVNGEIINSDAMQMYRGLDIATAKVTEEEKEGIEHHLLDIVDPKDKANVLDYKRQALAKIEEVLSRGKTPIIVGGTMYYTQSILWKSQLMDDNSLVKMPPRDERQVAKLRHQLQQMDAQQKYDQLCQVDPLMAQKLHVNNVRKVHRSLQVFYETGVPHSKWMESQRVNKRNQEKLFDACAFWVHCTKPVLDVRLSKRVETMLENGLEDEIKRLYEQVKHHVAPTEGADGSVHGEASSSDDEDDSHEDVDGSVGILQAIGFKEFYPLLLAIEQAKPKELAMEQRDELMKSCVEQLNIATRQYARRQLSWIRNHFVPRNIPVYQFDSSEVSQWPENVATPAVEIAKRFLDDQEMDEEHESRFRVAQETGSKVQWQQNTCEICGNRQFVTLEQWQAHLKSKKHKYHLKRVAIEKEQAEKQQQQQQQQQAEEPKPEALTSCSTTS